MAGTASTSSERPRRAVTGSRGVTRRSLLQGFGILTAAPWLARAGIPAAPPLALPLHLRQIVNHIGSSVPDVARSATFYSHLFEGGSILGQDAPALRYEIGFEPGSLSIGPLRAPAAGEPAKPFIDHVCVLADPYDPAAWRARLDREGIGYFAGGSFVRVGGISVQLLGARPPAGPKAPGARPPAGGGFRRMPPLYTGRPLVEPHGFEHVTMRVADLEASTALLRWLFGLRPQALSPRQDPARDRVAFRVGDVRLELQAAGSGEQPAIGVFGIRVAGFDRGRVSHELEALGARVEPPDPREARGVLRFTDPDGIHGELWPV